MPFGQTQMKTPVDGTTTGTSTKVINENKRNRTYLIIQNKGATNAMLVKIGAAHSGTEGILIPAGGNWEPLDVPTGAVYVLQVTGATTFTVVEGTN